MGKDASFAPGKLTQYSLFWPLLVSGGFHSLAFRTLHSFNAVLVSRFMMAGYWRSKLLPAMT